MATPPRFTVAGPKPTVIASGERSSASDLTYSTPSTTTFSAPIRSPSTSACGAPRLAAQVATGRRVPPPARCDAVHLDAELADRDAGRRLAVAVLEHRSRRAGVRGAVAGAHRIEHQVVRCAARAAAPEAVGALRRQVREPAELVDTLDLDRHPPVAARPGEDRTVQAGQDVDVALAGRPHRADAIGHVRVEHGDEAGHALDVLLEHDVGVGQVEVRLGGRRVVDLDGERSQVGDGGVVRSAGERCERGPRRERLEAGEAGGSLERGRAPALRRLVDARRRLGGRRDAARRVGRRRSWLRRCGRRRWEGRHRRCSRGRGACAVRRTGRCGAGIGGFGVTARRAGCDEQTDHDGGAHATSSFGRPAPSRSTH